MWLRQLEIVQRKVRVSPWENVLHLQRCPLDLQGQRRDTPLLGHPCHKDGSQRWQSVQSSIFKQALV